MSDPVNVDDFYDMCEAHDWHYERSNGLSRRYLSGYSERQGLRTVSIQTSDHSKLYGEFIAYKLFSDPKPERPIHTHRMQLLKETLPQNQEV